LTVVIGEPFGITGAGLFYLFTLRHAD